MITRRQLIYQCALLTLCTPLVTTRSIAALIEKTLAEKYPLTLTLLNKAYWSEVIANRHYIEYTQQALNENYPNIAYLFMALSFSEKVHADSFTKLILSFGAQLETRQLAITTSDTQTNLRTAAIKELEKINSFYPDIIDQLAAEAHDQTVLNCMYSWKSHRQHEEIIRDIKRYSGFFFGSLSEKIERMTPEYFVCDICGSTISSPPDAPCVICNYPMTHYEEIARPTLMMN